MGVVQQEEPLPLNFGEGRLCSEKMSEVDTLLYFKAPPVIGFKTSNMFPHEIVNNNIGGGRLLLNKIRPSRVSGRGVPWWRSGWESTCYFGGNGFEPWSGKIPHAAEQLSS